MTTGQTLRKLRQQKNISQLELELSVNLSTGTISRIENGRINPTKETLFKIAEFLNLNFAETTQLLGVPNKNDTSIIKNSVENYVKSISTLFGNKVQTIKEYSYSEGEHNFIEKCTQTLYRSSKEVLFIGNHDLFRKYYPEKLDKELYIQPRIANHLPAKIIACSNNLTVGGRNEENYLREEKKVSNFKVDLMANINDTSVVLMCINNAPSILEIFDKHIVEQAKKQFSQLWNL